MLSDSQIAEMNLDASFGQFVYKQDKETKMAVVAAICPELAHDPESLEKILDNHPVDLAFFRLKRRQERFEEHTSKPGYDSEEDSGAAYWVRVCESARKEIVTAVRNAAASLSGEEPAAKRARTDEPAAGGSKD